MEAGMDQTHQDDKKAPELEKETRFAVVMYGGVSLAIYINGVTQELYHMVRATARQNNNPQDNAQAKYVHAWKELSGTEKVYRCLGEALKTKFVVDILSGTSAGGINAVFLAKAIANQQSSMEFIKKFWVREGDISTLLNDKGSLSGLSGLSLQESTLGLMNSQRFYYKILEALTTMESRRDDFKSPYVEELDINITDTDIRGLFLPLYVNGGNAIQEARYKIVFQFYYRPKRESKDNKAWKDDEAQKDGPRNDFTRKMNPFLAFAARCTASIPPAFEAMQLKDIDPILGTAKFKKDYGSLTIHDEDWKRIYREYVNEGDDFSHRSFGDGGYLDNKPFSYATESILRRRADFPVDRRLIYIDPSPEHPEDKPFPSERPDMLENLLAALVVLPLSETIREDLKIIRERNRVISEIKNVLSNSFPSNPTRGEPGWVHKLDWVKKYLMDADMLAWYGNGYITYHQLRVESVLKNLSASFSQMLGWNESSREGERLRGILHAWLGRLYSSSPREKISDADIPWLKKNFPDYLDEKITQNDILFRLDLDFRMRKFYFLHHILNTIIRNLGIYLNSKFAGSRVDSRPQSGTDEAKKVEEMENILKKSGETLRQDLFDSFTDGDIENCRLLLLDLKSKVNDIYAYVRARDRYMRNGTRDDAQFDDYLLKLKGLKEELDKNSREDILIPLVEELSITLGTHLNAKKTGGYLYETFDTISEWASDLGIRRERKKGGEGRKSAPVVRKLLTAGELERNLKEKHSSIWAEFAKTAKGENLRSARNVVGFKICLEVYRLIQRCLAFYYDNYEYYDMLTFPIQYGTGAGESDEVEVIRISPEDATLLVDERKEYKKKLAGTGLMNFGSFFKEEWRENDIMWGRLDAAEILIRQVTGWKFNTNDMDEEEKKRWDRFKNDLREVHQELFPQSGVDFVRFDDFPFNLVFQVILEEDLCPRDKSIFYQFLDNTQEFLKNPRPIESPAVLAAGIELQDLDKRITAMDRFEIEVNDLIRPVTGSGAHLMRKQINEAISMEKARLRNQRNQMEENQKQKKTDETALKSRSQSFTQSPLFQLANTENLREELVIAIDTLRQKQDIRFAGILRALGAHEILNYFKLGYEIDRKFPPETLRTASRGFIVLEKLILELSKRHSFLALIKVPIRAVTRLGSGFAFAAQGDSYATTAAIVLYVSSLLLVLAGWLIPGFKDGIFVGLLALAVTLVAHLTVLRISAGFSTEKWKRIAAGLISLLLAVVAAAFFLLVFLVFYLGAVRLFGLQLPQNTIGTWIQLIVNAFSKN